ncbi:RAMP superfamily CRISPR-associated protein [Shewanella baltica]|uniref:RAMP superfamily CRISPR-associated protein n=1 Tax=Shewanella baltica TaxID=62322 RepID=UPI000DFE67C3|nr:RAMP superfamily CRISPR-associated protein [Shewanella baltica]SUI57501.1 CRISPR-associated RAMP protein, SSO1426 family [Shewanella baltica]
MIKSIQVMLTFDLRSEWHLGSGREGGAYADNLVQKSPDGLPIINGKTIKGLLRHAFNESNKYQWLPDADVDTIEHLFGREGTDLMASGALKCESATLNLAEQHYFKENPSAIDHLYRVRHATAIDPLTGTAQDGSLRAMEVVIPMAMQSRLTLTTDNPKILIQFSKWLDLSLPLLCSLGGKRRRGLGEVIVTATCQENC